LEGIFTRRYATNTPFERAAHHGPSTSAIAPLAPRGGALRTISIHPQQKQLIMKNDMLSTKKQPRGSAGFTLVELLFAVFFIFAALAAIIVATKNVTQTGKQNEAVKDIKTLIDGTRAWKAQPVRASSAKDTNLTIQELVLDGVDVGPFKQNGQLNGTYGGGTHLLPQGNGFRVIYGVLADDDFRECKALLDKFSSDPHYTRGNCKYETSNRQNLYFRR
jgi:type II secretory pathway pseudopilin PulG